MVVQAYRLPTHVRPTRYDIHLRARVDQPTFTGEVRIALRLAEPSRVIEMHARDLTIRDARLVAGGRTFEAKAEPHPAKEMVRFTLSDEAPAGEAEMVIAYEGLVSRNMEGLYLSKDGPEECLSTQCEETDARAIFPCFDEPAFKARFATTVTTTPENKVLANGPLVAVEESDGGAMRTWRFAPTKPMSSYLFACVVGRLASTSERVVEGVPLRVWAMEGKERFGDYAQDVAAKLLPWYNEYFAVPYHYDKYDQAAVPSFSAGAMENSGLVIFRALYLLHDPETTSWRMEKRIAEVISHEMAHMWFGNLVTMAWWDDIWLNESFAEWIAHKAVDAVFPHYGVWDDFQEGKASALVPDALASTHPIYAPVETAEQATENFDLITYQKGSSVMRMLERFLGEEAFREGLRTYMREFSEANAKGADLWRHLEQASRRPVTRIMTAWITEPGHPLVTVSLAGEGASGASLRLSQSRFLSTPAAPAAAQVWPVPLVVRHADAAGVHETRLLLDAPEATAQVPVQGSLRWLTANAESVGFYRQHLDDALLDRLLANLDELSSAEQAGLLEDEWGLVRSGRTSIARFLDVLARVLDAATHHAVLERATGYLARVGDLVEESGDEAALRDYRAWARGMLEPKMRAVGWDARPGEARAASETRRVLLGALAIEGEHPDALLRATHLADEEAGAPAGVDPNLAGIAVAVAARFGDAARFERHVQLYQARRAAKAPPAQTQRYLASFAAFREPALIERVMGLMETKTVAHEAIPVLLRSMLHTRHARVAAWEYMKRNWSQVREELGDMWTAFLVEASGNLPASRREDMVAFYDANLKGVAQQSYTRALEALDQRAEFERRTRAELVDWMRRRGPG